MKHRTTCLAIALAFTLTGCDEYREAKDAVSRTMLDPDRVKFRGVDYCPATSDIIHGEASGQNQLGAYTGFQWFYYTQYRVVFPNDGEFAALTDRCFGARAAPIPSASAAPTASAVADSKDGKAARRAKSAGGEPMDHYTAEDEAALEAAIAKNSRERCWQDYCPCDTSDPDYGGVDVTICRNLKGGLPVDDAMFSAGAAFRDGRRQMREAGAFN